MNSSNLYEKLFDNSKQAMFAAIEIYNKPKFDYREEVFIILLINSWELILQAILSKNTIDIFQEKLNDQTLKFDDSFNKASKFFEMEDKNINAIKKNLSSIRNYRNKVIHYYADQQMQHSIYALSQSAIKNYVDLSSKIFKQNIIDEVNIILLPLSFNQQPEFIEFFNQQAEHIDFVGDLFINLSDLEKIGADTSRFITTCKVKIESNNNIKSSDFAAIYDKNSSVLAVKKIDPNLSHPYLQNEILSNEKLKHQINSYHFQAIVWKYRIKDNDSYYWKPKKGGSPQYSSQVITFINSLTSDDIKNAKTEYTKNRLLRRKAG